MLPKPSGDRKRDLKAAVDRFRRADVIIDLGAGGLTGSKGAPKLSIAESDEALETMRQLVEQQVEGHLAWEVKLGAGRCSVEQLIDDDYFWTG